MTECACQECILRRKLAAIRESGTRDDLLAFCDQMLAAWVEQRGDNNLLKSCGIEVGQ